MLQNCRGLAGSCIMSWRQGLAGISFVKLCKTLWCEKHCSDSLAAPQVSPRLLGLDWPLSEQVTLCWLPSWPLHILPNVVLKRVPLAQLLGGLISGSVSQECPGEGTKGLQTTLSMVQCSFPKQVLGTKCAGWRKAFCVH